MISTAGRVGHCVGTGEPGHELLGAAVGVPADEGLSSTPVFLGRAGECQVVVSMRVRQCSSRRPPGLRCAATDLPAPPARGRRTLSEGVTMGRRQAGTASCLSDWATTRTPSRSTITCPLASGSELPLTSTSARARRIMQRIYRLVVASFLAC